ncbi:hypothetical protein D3C76_636180 [compost metagenome]
MGEDCRAGDEHVRACRGNLTDGLQIDAAVHFQADVAATVINQLARCGNLGQHLGDETLAAEARVDRHQQDQVKPVKHVLGSVQGTGRVEHQPRLATQVLDQLHGTVQVQGCLGMNRNVIGACLGEGLDHAVHRRHHQVHIDRRGNTVAAQGLAELRAHGQVGHIVIIHDIDMDDIGTGGQHLLGLLSQPGEIGRQNRRSNPEIFHTRTPLLID